MNLAGLFCTPYHVQWLIALRILLAIGGLLVLPSYLVVRLAFGSRFDIAEKLVLAFALAAALTTLAGLVLKQLGLPCARGPFLLVLGALILTAAVLAWIGRVPIGPPEGKASVPARWERIGIGFLLTVIIWFNADLVLRTRGSSLTLYGDELAHFCTTYQTLREGPFPDRYFRFSRFFPNWYAGGFPNLAASVATLAGCDPTAILRFLPLAVSLIWVLALYALAHRVAGDKLSGVLVATLSLGVSGGFTETAAPLVVLFSPWSLSWIFATSLLLLWLEQQKIPHASGPTSALCMGVLAGAALLIHPLLLWRFIPCVAPVALALALYSKRRRGLLALGGLSAVVAAAFVGAWAVPLYLKHGFWHRVPFEEIARRYAERLPEEVQWVRERLYFVPNWTQFIGESVSNAGVLTVLLSMGALVVAFVTRKAEVRFVTSWLVLTAIAAKTGWLTRAGRMFEFLVLAMLVASAATCHGLLNWFGRILPRRSTLAGWVCLGALAGWHLLGFLPDKCRIAFQCYADERVITSQSAKDWWQRFVQEYEAAQNSPLGLIKFRGRAVHFLVENNPDFWDLYLEAWMQKPQSDLPIGRNIR